MEIAVIDRGSGIDPKNLESIFNPFFTTKSERRRTWAWPSCSKIVDEHGGQITVESDAGRRQRVSRVPAGQARIEMKAYHEATILVIEDEEKLRRVIGLHLASAGYRGEAGGHGRRRH